MVCGAFNAYCYSLIAIGMLLLASRFFKRPGDSLPQQIHQTASRHAIFLRPILAVGYTSLFGKQHTIILPPSLD